LITRKEPRETNQSSSSFLSGLNCKDEKDIAKLLDQIKNDIEHADGLAFDGEPLSDEATDSFMDAMEFILQKTKNIEW
jgi:hypothetical protein